jgi:hypothetical protein
MQEVRIGIWRRGTRLFDWPALVMNNDAGRRVKLIELQQAGMVEPGDEVTFHTDDSWHSYVSEVAS